MKLKYVYIDLLKGMKFEIKGFRKIYIMKIYVYFIYEYKLYKWLKIF